ncbi:acyl-CoA dehydrogenase family protein [Bacteriovoracaceae bacterium]|nr:acyl-CoA dehydrogenase family protein [Bacteriovoracaceae bacterium]
MENSFDQDQSFVENLCVGHITESLLFPYPQVDAAEKETLSSIMSAVDDFLKDKVGDFRKWDYDGELPKDVIEEMKNFGLFGLIIPEDFDGIGLSTTGYSRTLQHLGRYDASVAITAGAHSSIGMKGLLLYGSDEQKKTYLSKLATGELIAAFCLTEAGSGSDAASIISKAVKNTDGWTLNGEKIWITNGGIADFFTVFAKTDGEKGKISAFIVTKDMEGISIGPHEDKMGIRASSTTTVRFENVKLTSEHLLGEEGKGFKIAMNILNSGRTGLGGGSVGGMKKMIELATEQASLRQQFGKSLSEFGLIKKKIGQMTVDCYACESVVNMVSSLIDRGSKHYGVEAAISKVMSTESLWNTIDESLQISGGNGFMREFPYERYLRDSRINRIFEGANDILRLFISLTAMNTATSLLKELGKIVQNPAKVFSDPIKGFGVFADYSKRFMSSNIGLGADKMTKVHPKLAKQQEVVERHTRTIAMMTDKLLRRYGKKIIDKQIACARLADMIIDVYALSCVLSRVTYVLENDGEKKAEREVQIANLFSHQVNARIENLVRQMDDNEDDSLENLADHTFEQGKFIWDNL